MEERVRALEEAPGDLAGLFESALELVTEPRARRPLPPLKDHAPPKHVKKAVGGASWPLKDAVRLGRQVLESGRDRLVLRSRCDPVLESGVVGFACPRRRVPKEGAVCAPAPANRLPVCLERQAASRACVASRDADFTRSYCLRQQSEDACPGEGGALWDRVSQLPCSERRAAKCRKAADTAALRALWRAYPCWDESVEEAWSCPRGTKLQERGCCDGDKCTAPRQKTFRPQTDQRLVGEKLGTQPGLTRAACSDLCESTPGCKGFSRPAEAPERQPALCTLLGDVDVVQAAQVTYLRQ